MTYTLKDKIFGFFGKYSYVRDTYKQGGDFGDDFEPGDFDTIAKGIWQRYNECLGEDYDTYIRSLVDDFHDNLLVPRLMLAKMIPQLESMVGNPVLVLDTEAMRRKILAFTQRIYDIRSTKLSYEVLMRLLGFDTVTITEFTITSGFDSDITLDDPDRVFDQGTKPCSFYSIALTGSITVDTPILEALRRIIDFLEPIWADLRQVTYNGNPISV